MALQPDVARVVFEVEEFWAMFEKEADFARETLELPEEAIEAGVEAGIRVWLMFVPVAGNA